MSRRAGFGALMILAGVLSGLGLAAGGLWLLGSGDTADGPGAPGAGAECPEPGGLDYNCSLPGTGFPWLAQARAADSWHGELGAPWHLGGLFVSTPDPGTGEEPYRVALPVRVGEDGAPVSMDDVYRMLCAVHPQLGGSGLREMTPDEKAQIDWGLVDESFEPALIPDLYTDGIARASDEAHLGWEPIRAYRLPPLPPALRRSLVTNDPCLPPGQESTTVAQNVAPQRWRVSVIGYEIDEMDAYWRITTGLRGAIRFDWDLLGEFTLEWREGKWEFGVGSVTGVSVRMTPLYEPTGWWAFRRLPVCANCGRYHPGRVVRGTVLGDEVQLHWGSFVPRVDVQAWITVSCTPMPGCAGWKERRFESSTFLDRVNGELLLLVSGLPFTRDVVDAEDLRWVHYVIVLHRLA